jgi:O-antigen/teichoic acid export membrane protein
LFAGANFVVQLGLARHWLSEHDFGAFAAAYVSFLVVGVFHTALLTEPAMTFGAERYRGDLPGYLGKLIGGHALIASVGGVLMGGIGVWQLLAGERMLGIALCCLAVGQAVQLLPWLLRGACYLESEPRPAGVAGLVYLFTVIALLVGFDYLGWMGIPAAVAAMALSSLVICVYLMVCLRVSLRAMFQRAGYAEVFRTHWHYGKWAAPTGLLRWVPDHLPILVVPLVLGWVHQSPADFESGGALKAMMHLSVPMVLFCWALSSLLVPMLVRRRGTPAFGRLSLRMLGLFLLGTLLAWPVLGLFHDPIIALVYAGRFTEHAWLLWLVGLIPVVVAIDSVLHAQLRAVERPDRLFYGSAASSLLLLFVGLPLLAVWGLPGMLAGVLLGYAVQACVLWMIGRHLIQGANRPPDDVAPAPSPTSTTGGILEAQAAPQT